MALDKKMAEIADRLAALERKLDTVLQRLGPDEHTHSNQAPAEVAKSPAKGKK
jgi:hypothetical protein